MEETRFQNTNQDYSQPTVGTDSLLLKSVFNWMFTGLLITAAVSYLVLSSEALLRMVFKPGVIIVLSIVELGLVFWLSARVMKMSATKATNIFIGYSALNGITLSPLMLIYTGSSLTTTFLTTSLLFGAMALYGNTTKRDLTGMGSFLMMGLIGIVIASIVNIFMKSSGMSFVISGVGVLVFTGLTAWEVQRIKHMSASTVEGTSDFKRFAIIGALGLYLNFINLFIMLLRFMGNSRD